MHKVFHGIAIAHIVIALVVIGGLVFGVQAIRNHVGLASPTAGVYCSPDGTLSENKSIQSHRSYCVKSNTAMQRVAPNTPVSYELSIVDDEGNTLKDFQVAHEMLLHLIVVRKDLMSFQHLHPDFNASTGTFTLSNLTFPSAGEYRIYADFVPSSAQMGAGGMPLNVVATEDVTVAGNYLPQSLQQDQATKTVDGYSVALTTEPKSLSAGTMGMLSFTIKKDSEAVTDLQPYLAALGHSVVIREDSLDYIHAHAVQEPTSVQNGTIDFHTDFPFGGKYKVFTQFKHDNKVMTVDYVLSVSGDAPEAAPSTEGHHMMPDGTMMEN